jgi:alginate O-acetyltransferase complex protein AlgI
VDLSKLLMSLILILVILILAVFIGLFWEKRARLWLIFVLSLLSVYIFQPLLPLRNFDYWFPTASIALTAATWYVLNRPRDISERENLVASSLSLLIPLCVGLTRLLPFEIPWLPASNPPLTQILLVAFATALLIGVISLGSSKSRPGSWILIIVLAGLFILLKAEPLALWLSERIRRWQGQSTSLASIKDLNWLGFSYISFRLIHALRDYQSGRLPRTNLREFMTFVLFFPAIVAGPIDRIERFIKDLRVDRRLNGDRALASGQRLLLGFFKKFILADGLALFALNSTNAALTTSTGWTWLLLYAYSFRLYLDFSGYTDVAIGLGMLTGMDLPENFDRPYLKMNLAAFWNSWHITLARWFRSYFFNPVTRWFRAGPLASSTSLIILIGQISTMVLIGLWHGVSWNFAIWGLWHGVGLFVHNRWVDFIRTTKPSVLHRLPEPALHITGTLLTFHFITLGWVWFALPEVGLSIGVFKALLGLPV